MAIECPRCRTQNPEESRFCNSCATSLTPLKHVSVLPSQGSKTDTGELTRGTVFAGRYQVIEELGQGGMGRVFRVEDSKINEEVALKV